MNLFLLIVLLGFANHLATSIITESEITRESRAFLERLHQRAVARLHSSAHIEAWSEEDYRAPRWHAWAELITRKLSYLHGCHLCAGTWVGLVMAAFVPPIVSSGLVGWALTGLAIKGVGHIVLVVHKYLEAKQHEHEAFAKQPHPKPDRLDEDDDRPSYYGWQARSDHTHWSNRPLSDTTLDALKRALNPKDGK